LKIERVRAKILGVLFDQIFNQTLSGLEVTIYSQITNKSYYSLTNEDGVFKYYFSLAKYLNYSFSLTVDSNYFFPTTTSIFLNASNNFSYNESINLIRENIEMIIEGCVSPNSSNLTAFVSAVEGNQTVFLTNSTNSEGCFILEVLGFEGVEYYVELNITSQGYYNKSMIMELDYANNYTINLGNVSLEKIEENFTIVGICFLNSSNQTIENVLIYLTLEEDSNSNTKIVYRTKSQFDGQFMIIMDEVKNNSSGVIKFRKEGLEKVTLMIVVDSEEGNQIDLGIIYFTENN